MTIQRTYIIVMFTEQKVTILPTLTKNPTSLLENRASKNKAYWTSHWFYML